MRAGSFLRPEGFSRSASRIWLFEQCQKCFYLKYILGMPEPEKDISVFSYGTAVHETIEAMSQWLKKEFPLEHFNDAKAYENYKRHIEIYDNSWVWDWVLVNEIEFIRHDEHQKFPYYGFLDWIVFDKAILECIPVHGYPRAVQILENGNLLWTCIRWDGIHKVESANWYFWWAKVIKLQEMKTQAQKWSYNKIKVNDQFTLYHQVKDIFFGTDVIMQLINFFREPSAGIQKERIHKTQLDYDKLRAKVQNIQSIIDEDMYSPISTCSYFGPFRDICPSFTI